MTVFGGITFHTSPYMPQDRILLLKRDQSLFFHPATTHALINGIPLLEAHHVWNFWQGMNRRLDELADEALRQWQEAA